MVDSLSVIVVSDSSFYPNNAKWLVFLDSLKSKIEKCIQNILFAFADFYIFIMNRENQRPNFSRLSYKKWDIFINKNGI